MLYSINKELILNFIKDNNLTKKQFCEKIKISVLTLNRTLNNKKIFLKTLLKIAIYTKLKIEYLVTFNQDEIEN